MPRLSVPLNTLEIFAEAGRLQSFRKAGESLSLSTSAVSQAVRKLEGRLSCKLFDRTGNAVTLNGQGARLLREVEMGIEYMRLGLDAITASYAAPLSISSPPGLATLLTPVIQRLIDQEVSDVRFVSDEVQDFSSHREFDVSLFYGRQAGQNPGAISLGADVFTPVCRPDVAALFENSDQRISVPLLVNETATVTWDDWLQANGISGRSTKRLYFNRAAHIISALIDGVGIGLESLRILSPQLQRGELVRCPLGPGISLRHNLTFLYVTNDPARKERADKAAKLIQEYCSTDDDGIVNRFRIPSA